MEQSKEKISSFKVVVKCVKYFSKYVFKERPVFYVYYIGLILCNAIGPFINIIGTRYLIDELVYKDRRDLQVIIFWVAFMAIGNFVQRALDKQTSERSLQIYDELTIKMESELSMYSVKMKFAETENPSTLDAIKKASRGFQETNCVRGIMEPFAGIIARILVIVGVATLVLSCSIYLVIPVIASFIINTIFNWRMNKVREKYYDEIAEAERILDYFGEDLNESRYAKDIRLYNGKELLINKYLQSADEFVRKIRKSDMGMCKNSLVGVVAGDLCNVCLYGMLGVKALLKQISIGEFSSLLQATTQFSQSIEGIVDNYIGLDYTSHILTYYIDFAQEVDDTAQQEVINSVDIPEEVYKNIQIEFRNVSFKYPNTELYVLKNVSTKISQGEHLSIVGENGTGKTTFIKLLCRLYPVTEGKILLNGININQFAYNDYLKLLAVVFQDYKLLAFSIKENIVLNDKGISDSEIMELCKLGGIDDWVEGTSKKLDTILYKMFDQSGIEPSGGQAQKIAITRALYKNAPVVILDEPTASLDPISEYEIYKNFDKLVGGKTAVYISHRLSSCRFCDRIIVFQNGTIIEEGCHDKLYNIEDGFYANMYKTQAKHYK